MMKLPLLTEYREIDEVPMKRHLLLRLCALLLCLLSALSLALTRLVDGVQRLCIAWERIEDEKPLHRQWN